MTRAIDDWFAGQRARLTSRQITAVREWQQRTNRAYERVQAIARGEIDPDQLPCGELAEALELMQALDNAIQTGRLPGPITVYRGIRSLRRTFGVDDPADLHRRPRRAAGYVGTSVLRDVAVREFTSPRGALLEIALPAQTPALWVAGVGDPQLRYQAELLLPDRLRYRVVGSRKEGDLRVVFTEVIADDR